MNRYPDEAGDDETPILVLDPGLETSQVERLAEVRARRDERAVAALLDDLRHAATGSDNLLYPMKAALASLATMGEVSDVLREVFGTYRGS